MALNRLDPLDLADEITKRAIEPILDRVNELSEVTILDGRLIRDVVLTTTELQVAHRLAKVPTGYIVTKRSANATVFGTSLTNRFLNLTSSASVIVDLWVF